VKKLLSHREDATLANLYAPPVRGWEQVAQTLEHASSYAETAVSRKCCQNFVIFRKN
jgi:hypothetical protein